MDSLKSIIDNLELDLPAEVGIIKKYITTNYQADVKIVIKKNDLIISSRSSALISLVRADYLALRKAINNKYNLRFKIG